MSFNINYNLNIKFRFNIHIDFRGRVHTKSDTPNSFTHIRTHRNKWRNNENFFQDSVLMLFPYFGYFAIFFSTSSFKWKSVTWRCCLLIQNCMLNFSILSIQPENLKLESLKI